MTQIDQDLLPSSAGEPAVPASSLPSPAAAAQMPAPPPPVAQPAPKRAASADDGAEQDGGEDSKITPALVRKIAKYVTGFASLEPATRRAAAAAFGLPFEADDAALTVATLTVPVPARWVLRFLISTKTGTLGECMDAVATLMGRPRGEMQKCWRVLAALDVVSGNMVSNEGKAAQALVMAMADLTVQHHKILSDAMGAMAWQR